jgi:hypothetical protein
MSIFDGYGGSFKMRYLLVWLIYFMPV